MSQSGLLFECPSVDGQPPKFAPVPLTGVIVDVQVIDLIAQVTIYQNYVNRESQPIEAVYLFPLDEGAGVCEFSAEVEGRQIIGKVKAKEEAQKDYDEAIQTGHSAFLLEEKLPDVFKAKVGNLAPGSGARVKISYVTELKVEPGGEIRFYLPATIAPRYVPGNDSSSVASDLANVTYTSQSHYKIEFKATVITASAIKEIRSPTHKLSAKILQESGNKSAIVQLEEVLSQMDRDLVFYVQVNEPNKPRLIFQKSSNGTGAAMLSLVPIFKLADQKTEMIFVIDRSGSMMGAGIQQAKQALKLFLHSLPVDCYVNIIGFGSSFQSLFPSSKKYDGETLAAAKSHAEALDANLGGTEIFQPLNWVLKLPNIEGYLRQIFILTDGEVSNADQVISLIRQESGHSRVFALGLGSSASHHLVEGMARAGNGTALFASLDERLEKKVLQQLQDAIQPSLTDVKVKWDGHVGHEEGASGNEPVPVQTEKTLMGYGKPLNQGEAPEPVKQPVKLRQAPGNSAIPPVFDGRHTVVYALLTANAHVPKWAEITASSPDGPLSLRIDLDTNNLDNGLLIQRLAGKKLIQLLQDKVAGSPDAENEINSEIIALACEYGLASRYTSYIAVDTAENSVLKESWMTMKSRDIPLEVAQGWGGSMMVRGAPPMAKMMARPMPAMQLNAMPTTLCRPCDGVPLMAMRRPAMMVPMAAVDHGAPAVAMAAVPHSLAADAAFSDSLAMNFCRKPEQHDAPPRVNAQDLSDDDKVIQIVSVQNFDGSFQLATVLAELLASTVEELKTRGQRIPVDEDVWATCLALAYFSLALASLRDSWALVANKAEKWMSSKQLINASELKEEAEKYVKEKLNI